MNQVNFKDALAVAFEYSYLHEDWVTPVEEALAGISAQDALRRPEGGKGIWDIVLHLAAWNENIVERVRSGLNAHPTEGAWPLPPVEPDEEEWSASKLRLDNSFNAVKNLIATASFDQYEQSPYGIPDLICRFTHAGYHLGQIQKMREIWRI